MKVRIAGNTWNGIAYAGVIAACIASVLTPRHVEGGAAATTTTAEQEPSAAVPGGPTSKPAPRDESSKPIVSIVLLLKEPRKLDAGDIAAEVEKAWGVKLEDGADAPNFVVGIGGVETPFFLLVEDCAYMIRDWPRPFVDDAESAARDLPSTRLQDAVRQHRAWISVELMRDANRPPDLASNYTRIARLVDELADDDDTLAMLRQSDGRIIAWDATVRQLLREDPKAALGPPLNMPPVTVEWDDPRMVRAVAEAKRRRTEFVNAFNRRESSGDKAFSVMSSFGEGERREFEWMWVDAVVNDVIYGKLNKEPTDVPRVKRGDRVQVKLADICDWAFISADRKLRGGFTARVHSEAQRESDRRVKEEFGFAPEPASRPKED